MTNYLRFNRHEEMEGFTRDEILDLVRNPKLKSIENYLYGLYDGYFYFTKINEMIQDNSLSSLEKYKLCKLYITISNYKSLK